MIYSLAAPAPPHKVRMQYASNHWVIVELALNVSALHARPSQQISLIICKHTAHMHVTSTVGELVS